MCTRSSLRLPGKLLLGGLLLFPLSGEAHKASKVFVQLAPVAGRVRVTVAADRLTIQEWQAQQMLDRASPASVTESVANWLQLKLHLYSQSGSRCTLHFGSADPWSTGSWALYKIVMDANCSHPAMIGISPDFIWNDPLYQVIVEARTDGRKNVAVLTREMTQWRLPQTMVAHKASRWQAWIRGCRRSFAGSVLVVLGLIFALPVVSAGWSAAWIGGWLIGITTTVAASNFVGVVMLPAIWLWLGVVAMVLLACGNLWWVTSRSGRRLRLILSCTMAVWTIFPLVSRGMPFVLIMAAGFALTTVVLIAGLRLLVSVATMFAVQVSPLAPEGAYPLWRRRIARWGSVLLATVGVLMMLF